MQDHLIREVSNAVDGRADEMEAIWVALVVVLFEILCSGVQELARLDQVLLVNLVLPQIPDPTDGLAEVSPVVWW